jgi:hypothetical protein
MLRTHATGWKTQHITLRKETIEVLVLPRQHEMVCLPAYPRIARTSEQIPVFSLTLITGGIPLSDEADPEPFVTGSLLTLGLTLQLPDEALLALNQDGSYRPLYTQNALFALVYRQPNGQELVLAAQPTGGANARATLSLLCGRDETLELLRALAHAPNALSIRVYITYQHVPGTRCITLNGNWQAIRAVVVQVIQPKSAGFITCEELECCFHAMLDTGVIQAVYEGDGVMEADLYQKDLFALFVRNIAPILKATKSADETGKVVAGFVLKRQYLDETMKLDCRQVITGSELQLLQLNAPLERLCGGLLEEFTPTQFVSAVHYPAGSAVPLRPARRSDVDVLCGAGI